MDLKEFQNIAKDLTILYAEDNELVQNGVYDILKRLFRDIHLAKDGEEALKLYLYNKNFDIVLTDIDMPKLDGVELTEAIKSESPTQPVVVMSAYNTQEYLFELINLNIDGFIVKPISKDSLISTLFKISKNIYNSKMLRERERELEELNAMYELSIEASGVGLWDANLKDGSVYRSKTWRDMLGYSIDDEIPNVWENLIHPKDYPKVMKRVEKALLREVEFFESEHRLKMKSGEYRWIQSKGKVFFEKERAIRAIGYHLDIDNLMRLKEKLRLKSDYLKSDLEQERDKFKALEDLIKSISHHWRQPLNVINLTSQNLREEIKFNRKISKSYIATELLDIEKRAQFLSSIISQFQTFIKDKPKESRFLLKQTIESFLFKVIQKNRDINYQVIGDEGYIKSYKFQFLDILKHLIENSIDSLELSQGSKEIEIEIELKDSNTKIYIRDSGVGVDESISDKIFEPYFSTKFQSENRGLSLYMAKMILNRYFNAELYCNKNYKNGAEFIIDFRYN